MQAILDAFIRDNPIVPGVILHLEAAGGAWAGAAGVADTAAGTPMRPDMTFRIASNTKTFTAAAVLRLVEQDRLALDDRIARYFPAELVARLNVIDGVSHGERITIRQALNHTAGLYDWGTDDAYAAVAVSDPGHRWTPLEQVEFALAHGNPYGAPGEVFHYSDTGYVLASLVVEQLSGLPLAAAFRELLRFDALGLAATHLESLEPVPVGAGERIHQYIARRDGNEVDASFDLYGGGGLVSSAADLARFWRALFAGQVFDRADSLQEMLTTVPTDQPERQAGLGIFRRLFGNTCCWNHNGFWGSFAIHEPGRGITVTGVANQNRAHQGPEAATLKLVTAVLQAAGIP
ncbi:MAG: beta-lactamase family protein [Chloroflexi bacterium]|nr:beta-lactamase family protein [Chloroflexota bacterium]